LAAMKAGSSIVTANKALLAQDGASLFAAAEEAGVDLFFEASVAGAIPLLRPIRESLAGDQIHRVLGIVNGTTNYILTRMDEAGVSYDDALAEAQELGYAEADPSADVDGDDAAAKAAILAELAFHTPVTRSDVWSEGITGITSADKPGSSCECTRPWCRGSIHWQVSVRRSTQSSLKRRVQAN
jgi:homoserine dehydrogenase